MLPEKYPGCTVRVVDLQKGDEFGCIRLQWYDECSFRVGSFLPGEIQSSPGDTPKVWPEHYEDVKSWEAADILFEQYVIKAEGYGWVQTYQMDHVQWCVNTFNMIRDGGSWIIPRSQLIFEKRGKQLALRAKMEHQEGMPISAEELKHQQRAEFYDARRHFALFGVEVVDKTR